MSRAVRAKCGWVVVGGLLVGWGAAPAMAQGNGQSREVLVESRPSLVWRDDWVRFRATEYIATGVFALGAAGLTFAFPKPIEPKWRQPILLDDNARIMLRMDSSAGRNFADALSDVFLYSLVAYPYFDALAVAWAGRGSSDVAGQMLAMNTQAFALTTLLTNLSKDVVARARPYVDTCDSGTRNEECRSADRYRSFLSGHTSTAFTGAALVCAHHGALPLYGSRLGDNAACATAMTAASAVGMLRMISDRHYLSDVAAGAALGLLSGYVLPTWLHYGIGKPDRKGSPTGGRVSPLFSGGSVGVRYSRIF